MFESYHWCGVVYMYMSKTLHPHVQTRKHPKMTKNLLTVI